VRSDILVLYSDKWHYNLVTHREVQIGQQMITNNDMWHQQISHYSQVTSQVSYIWQVTQDKVHHSLSPIENRTSKHTLSQKDQHIQLIENVIGPHGVNDYVYIATGSLFPLWSTDKKVWFYAQLHRLQCYWGVWEIQPHQKTSWHPSKFHIDHDK